MREEVAARVRDERRGGVHAALGVIRRDLAEIGVAQLKLFVDLVRVQWNSVRKAEGHGFYNWETERKEIPAGHWTVTTQAQPAPLHIPIENGGFYQLTATAKDEEGRSTKTKTSFYAMGEG